MSNITNSPCSILARLQCDAIGKCDGTPDIEMFASRTVRVEMCNRSLRTDRQQKSIESW